MTTDNGTMAVSIICLSMLIILCSGDPDLLDALISYLMR